MRPLDLQNLTAWSLDDAEEFIYELNDPRLQSDLEVELRIGDIQEFPETRNVAYTMCQPGGPALIVFAPKLDDLTLGNIDAVLRHEIAHVLDLCYPSLKSTLREHYSDVPPTTELFADWLAGLIWDEHIYYDDDLIQTTDVTSTSKRPRHLGL